MPRSSPGSGWRTGWWCRAYLLTLAAGVLISARLTAGYVQLDIPYALLLMVLEVTLLLTITLAGGTRFSTVTNGIVALGIYGISFIGGWVEQIGALAGIQSARYIGIAASLVSPADSLWRLGIYRLQPGVVRGLDVGPFAAASVPNAVDGLVGGGVYGADLPVGPASVQPPRPLTGTCRDDKKDGHLPPLTPAIRRGHVSCCIPQRPEFRGTTERNWSTRISSPGTKEETWR